MDSRGDRGRVAVGGGGAAEIARASLAIGRVALIVVLLGACTHAQAPMARRVGKVMAIAGVSGLIAAAVSTHFTSEQSQPILIAFTVSSVIGVGLYAAGDLTAPTTYSETRSDRNQRWARILTERAHGYAREGRCPRVRHIEPRVRVYDRLLHDTVFMRDPEIQKCLAGDPIVPQVPVSEPVPAVEDHP
jgi:hypothetical protein